MRIFESDTASYGGVWLPPTLDRDKSAPDDASSTDGDGMEQWPPTLKAAITVMFNMKTPSLVLWGGLRLTFFNEAYQRLPGGQDLDRQFGMPAEQFFGKRWTYMAAEIASIFGKRSPVVSEVRGLAMINRFPVAADTGVRYHFYGLPIEDLCAAQSAGGVLIVADEGRQSAATFLCIR